MPNYALSLCELAYLNPLPEDDLDLSKEGKAKLLEEAYQEGIEIGREEARKKILKEMLIIAQNLIKMDISLEQVSQAVNIPLDELKEHLNIEQ
jgi:predicted transposase YdaD